MFGRSKTVATDKAAIGRLLSRAVEEVLVRESLEKKLMSGKVLRIKLGFDPTGPKIHIGRAIILRKLREFQDLGHQAVFVVGDFTAMIGDPSDKLEKRPMLTKAAIEKNLEHYRSQVGKIIDLSRAEFHYNSRWLSRLKFAEIAELSESFSVLQMSARRNFKTRLERGDEVSLREFLYPLMQGYDSVAVKADVEIGGFDQLFNLKAGRIVQRHYQKPEQDILTTAMLEGTDGRKMSTSWENVINITDEPDDMFGKIMSVKDELVSKYLLLCTDVAESDIEALSKSPNPRDAKLRLAKEIVSLYHGDKKAALAQENFISIFSQKAFPADAPEKKVLSGTSLADVIADVAGSRSEFARLIADGAIFDFKTNQKVADRKAVVTTDMDLRIGKHRFVRIRLNS